jgi:hypothetical protein
METDTITINGQAVDAETILPHGAQAVADTRADIERLAPNPAAQEMALASLEAVLTACGGKWTGDKFDLFRAMSAQARASK